MITLIGSRCTHSNVLSRGVLITRFLLGNVNVALLCSVLWDESHVARFASRSEASCFKNYISRKTVFCADQKLRSEFVRH